MTRVAQLYEHAKQLYIDLGSLADGDTKEVGKPIADVYNTLLGLAKKQFPTDRVVGVLEPVDEEMHPRVVQALVAQLRLVLGNT